MKTEKFTSSREIVFVNTLKFTANTMMAMLFMVLTFCSCSKEVANHHPAQASNLMGSMNKAQGHGYATIDVEAHATDASSNPISAEAHVKYQTVDVEVENEEELGLPVILTANPDGSFTTNNGNVITREESHSANGVTMNVAGGFPQEGSLGERTDEGDQIRQIVFAKISDEAFATASLPEKFDKDWRDSTISVVEFHRIWKKKAAPVEPEYRKTLTIDWSDTKGSVYADMLTEKVQGETILEKAAHYDVMAQWGQYKPEVKTISVTGTSFRNEDILGVNAWDEKSDKDVPGLGDDGKYTRKCIRHTTETYSDVFTSTPDVSGNTDRAVRCNLDTWLYEYTCTLSDGHTETFKVEFEIKSIKNDVDPDTNIYERIIEVRINGQLVDTMSGKVQLVF